MTQQGRKTVYKDQILPSSTPASISCKPSQQNPDYISSSPRLTFSKPKLDFLLSIKALIVKQPLSVPCPHFHIRFNLLETTVLLPVDRVVTRVIDINGIKCPVNKGCFFRVTNIRPFTEEITISGPGIKGEIVIVLRPGETTILDREDQFLPF